MRLAVISDIHGNHVALETALADIERSGCDCIVCLGDAIQGGPQPAEVVHALRERNIPTVMGNADAWLLSGVDSGAEQISEPRMQRMLDVRGWALSKLSARDKQHIGEFQPTIRIELGDQRSLLCFHGSPKSFDDILLPDSPFASFEELLPLNEATFFTGGHTHVQFVRQLGNGFHSNPGSIGAAYRHGQSEDQFKYDPFAEYAVLSTEGALLGLEFRRIPFDTEKLVRVYRTSGMPHSENAISSLSGTQI